ncbi:MAG: hypothetical protein H6620_12675 [Halobacteriovoraceae bacterium]|nr:hypothetical protein [Halobacteriovoraceae bacterium]
MGPVEFPAEVELLSFFSSEPIKEDDIIYYSYKDLSKNELLFYFSFSKNIVGLSLKQSGEKILSVSYEDLKKIEIQSVFGKNMLIATCISPESQMLLKLSLSPRINIVSESISI